MRAGDLSQKIEIYEPVITRNEFNEQVTEYVLLTTTRAKVVYNSGGRTIENYETFYAETISFEIRKYVQVSNFCQVKYNDSMYRIIRIEEGDNRSIYNNNKRLLVELVNE